MTRYYGEQWLKLVTARQMGEIDSKTIEMGIPGIVLMENAALSVIDEIYADFPDVGHITVVCGKGNNGGDGFAIARHLINKGANAHVFLIGGKEPNLTGDALANYEILKNIGVKVDLVWDRKSLALLEESMGETELIVDAIFGTGIKGDIRGIYADVINRVVEADAPVMSVDIPSGLNGDTGQIQGLSIKAYKTVTFGPPKIGLVAPAGIDCVGELVIADISIPDLVVQRMKTNTYLTTARDVNGLFPKRKMNSHKNNYGHAFVVGGSTGFTGAISLTAQSTLRTGAGLVTVGVPETVHHIIELKLTEPMSIPLPDKGNGTLNYDALDLISRFSLKCNCMAIGPGMSNTNDTAKLMKDVIGQLECPCIIDADGLNCIADDVEVLKQASAPLIVTPHPGEMSRLTDISASNIVNNAIEITREFAQEFGVIVVLKAARAIVASPSGDVYINTTGTPAMATGGTGDVLTGIILGLLAQNTDPVHSAIAGAYLCGLAGEIGQSIKGEYALIAGDIIDNIPWAINIMEEESPW